MNVEYTESLLPESILLDEQHEVSLNELAEFSGLSPEELYQLVDSGVLIPINPEAAIWHFNSHYVISIRTLCRLKQDFELESNSLALMLTFLERIRILEHQLNRH
ncbi:MAG: chaperone modulator CbpM [Pseudomonadota bacterium]|jgi:chaperone modulatory protein CbpM